MDRKPETFGWRIWRLGTLTGSLTDADHNAHMTFERRTASRPVYFEAFCAHVHPSPVPECRCGLAYVTSSFYCEWSLYNARQSYLRADWSDENEVQFAATYGWYDGGIGGVHPTPGGAPIAVGGTTRWPSASHPTRRTCNRGWRRVTAWRLSRS